MDLFGIITFIGIFQLLMLTAIALHHARRRPSNIFLALFFFAQITAFANSTLYRIDGSYLKVPYLFNIAYPFFFIWGPTIYFAIRFETFGIIKFKLKHFIHFLPAVAVFVYLAISFHLKGVEIKSELVFSETLITNKYSFIISKIIDFIALVYCIFGVISLEKYIKKFRFFTRQQHLRIQWNRFIIYGYLVTCIFYNISNFILEWFAVRDKYFFHLLIIFTCYFTAILYRSLSSPHFSAPIEKDKQLALEENDAEKLKTDLEELMTERKLFLEPELTLSQLSEKLDVKEKHLSEVLNKYLNKNFSEYINDYRIEEAKILLSVKNSKKTVLEIIYASGFNSKSAFNLAFKNNTGITPTQYRKSTQPLLLHKTEKS